MSLALALANIGGEAFYPTNISSIKAWWDPTRGLTGSTTKTWTDQVSGLGLVQQVANSASFQAGNSINGAATIDANGTTFLQSAGTLGQIISATGYWALIVFRYTGSHAESGVSNPYLIGDSATYWTKTCSTTKLDNAHYDGAQKDDQATITTSTNYYAVCTYNGTTIQTSLNGGAFDTGTTAGSVAVLTNVLQSCTSSFTGSLGDIIVGNATLSARDASSLMAWAHTRYGI